MKFMAERPGCGVVTGYPAVDAMKLASSTSQRKTLTSLILVNFAIGLCFRNIQAIPRQAILAKQRSANHLGLSGDLSSESGNACEN